MAGAHSTACLVVALVGGSSLVSPGQQVFVFLKIWLISSFSSSLNNCFLLNC